MPHVPSSSLIARMHSTIATIRYCIANRSPQVQLGVVDGVWYGTCNLKFHRPNGVRLSPRIVILEEAMSCLVL
jgi:hypothetical protein